MTAPTAAEPTTPIDRLNFGNVWEAIADAVPERIAVVDRTGRLTYRDFESASARLAGWLAEQGIGAGDKVAIYSYNRPEYLIGLFAIAKLSAVPVNINFRYRTRELADLLASTDSVALLFPASLQDRVLPLQGSPVLPEVRVVFGDGDVHPAAGTAFADAVAAPLARRVLPPSDPIFVLTGGTTGTPKAVIWTQGQLLDSQQFLIYNFLPVTRPTCFREVVEIAARDDLPSTVTLPLTPLMHATALFSTMDALVVGGTVVLLSEPRFDPDLAARTIQQEGVTRIVVAGNAVALPLVSAYQRAAATGSPYDATGLRVVLSSGMLWSDTVKQALLEHATGATLIDIFAASEGGPFAYGVASGPQDFPNVLTLDPQSVVLDEDGREVQDVPGAVGVLAYRGRIPEGYYNDEARTRDVYPVIDGFRHVIPRDVVRVLPHRGVEVLGRGSSVINTGGEKVYPNEVEDVILQIDGVRDVAVVGIADPVWGEVVSAAVVLADGATATTESILARVKSELAGYKAPKTVTRVESLERTPTGKVNVADVRALIARDLSRTHERK